MRTLSKHLIDHEGGQYFVFGMPNISEAVGARFAGHSPVRGGRPYITTALLLLPVHYNSEV